MTASKQTADRPSVQLDRRRGRAAAATAAVDQAKAKVTELDDRLSTNADTVKSQKQAMRNAVAEADRLKRLVKAGAKERDRLAKARKKAAARVDKAQAKAKTAEARYDKSVLAEMVRREKDRDRATAGTTAG